MASSTCIKCGNTSFELKEQEPRGSAFKLMFVQCTSCGGVVGVIEHDNIGALVVGVEDLLKRVAESMGIE